MATTLKTADIKKLKSALVDLNKAYDKIIPIYLTTNYEGVDLGSVLGWIERAKPELEGIITQSLTP